MYPGICTGRGGGGDSDAKWEIFQFSPFFSKMSFRGGRYVTPFRNLQEMAVSERLGFWGGGGGGHIFSYRTRTFWHFGVFSKNLVSPGVVCIQGFTVLGVVLQHVVSMANFSVIVNDADFYAESTGEGPTLQLNDVLGKFNKNFVQAYVASKCVWLA